MTLTSGQQEVLKWLAISTMLIDHIGAILLPEWWWLRWIGRLAFPLFGLLLAYNLEVRGVSPDRYIRPLALFAIISQPIYTWAFDTLRLNIFFTLLLGVIVVKLLQTPTVWRGIVALASLAVLGPFVEYSYPGAVLILAFVMALRKGWFWPVAAIVVVALNRWLGFGAAVPLLLIPFILALRSLPVGVGRSSRWLFYVFYPLHLFLLKGLALLLVS